MTKRDLPPLRSLKAFEAFARLGSFSHAASELGVTRWAVSYQVKSLEKRLGVQLYRRDTKRAELTRAGKTYFPSVRIAFGMIEQNTRAVKSALTATVTVDHSLARLPVEHDRIDAVYHSDSNDYI